MKIAAGGDKFKAICGIEILLCTLAVNDKTLYFRRSIGSESLFFLSNRS